MFRRLKYSHLSGKSSNSSIRNSEVISRGRIVDAHICSKDTGSSGMLLAQHLLKDMVISPSTTLSGSTLRPNIAAGENNMVQT